MDLLRSFVNFFAGESTPDNNEGERDEEGLEDAPVNAPRLYLSQSEPYMTHTNEPDQLPQFTRNVSSPARVSNLEQMKKTSWMSIYPHSRHPIPLVFCRLCYENNYPMDSWKLQSCSHSFCLACTRAYLTAQLNSGVTHIGCPFQHECNTRISREEIELILPQAAQVGEDMHVANRSSQSVFGGRGDFFIMSTNTESDRDLNDATEGQSNHGNIVELQLHETVCLDSQLCPQCGVTTYRLNCCNQITCRACSTEWCWLCRKRVDASHYEIGNVLGCPGAQFSPDRRSLNLRREFSSPAVPQQPPAFRIFSDLTVDSNDVTSHTSVARVNSCAGGLLRRMAYSSFSLLVIALSVPFLPFTCLHYLLVRRQQSSYLLPGYTLCACLVQLIFLPFGCVYYLCLLISRQDTIGDGYLVIGLPITVASKHWLDDNWGIGVWDWRVDGCCCSLSHIPSTHHNTGHLESGFVAISSNAPASHNDGMSSKRVSQSQTNVVVDGVYDPQAHQVIEMQSQVSPRHNSVSPAQASQTPSDGEENICLKIIQLAPRFTLVLFLTILYFAVFFSVSFAVSVPFLPIMLVCFYCGCEHRENFADTVMLPGYVFWAVVFQAIYLPFGLLLFIPCFAYDALLFYMRGPQPSPDGGSDVEKFSIIEEIKWIIFPPLLAAYYISRDFFRVRKGCCPFVIPLVYAIPCAIASLMEIEK